jgi:hypothetical protein
VILRIHGKYLRKRANKLGDKYNYQFYEVSALMETGLDVMFNSMTRKAKKKHENNDVLVNTQKLKRADHTNGKKGKKG